MPPMTSPNPQSLATASAPDPAHELADHLRRLADEIERDGIGRLKVTVIRPNGRIERLGNIPDVISLI